MWADMLESDASSSSSSTVSLEDIANMVASLVQSAECPDEKTVRRFVIGETSVEMVFLHRQLLISVTAVAAIPTTSSQLAKFRTKFQSLTFRPDQMDHWFVLQNDKVEEFSTRQKAEDRAEELTKGDDPSNVYIDCPNPLLHDPPADLGWIGSEAPNEKPCKWPIGVRVPRRPSTPRAADNQIHVYLDNVEEPDGDFLVAVNDKDEFKKVASAYTICHGYCPSTRLIYTSKRTGSGGTYTTFSRATDAYVEALRLGIAAGNDDAEEYDVMTNASTWHESVKLRSITGLRKARLYVKQLLTPASPQRWYHLRSMSMTIDYEVKGGVLITKCTTTPA